MTAQHPQRDTYSFGLLHPAAGTAAERADNDRVLGLHTLGIEVTVPALAVRCELGNIDPQHDGGGDRRTAVEVCFDWPLPPDGARLATIRPDLDALGGMGAAAPSIPRYSFFSVACVRSCGRRDASLLRQQPSPGKILVGRKRLEPNASRGRCGPKI